MKKWALSIVVITSVILTLGVIYSVKLSKPTQKEIFGNSIITYNKADFSPANNESFPIHFSLVEQSKVSIKIYSSDNDLIKTIAPKDRLQAGRHVLRWNGKDENNIIVPDEAYIPVLEIINDNKQLTVIDSRSISGGEQLDNLQTHVDKGKITYTLPKPGRALIRAGIKSGPLMRTIHSWKPQTKGLNRVSWDGFDQDKIDYIADDPGLAVLVLAFALPEHSIITHGNNEMDYRQYRKSNHWAFNNVNPENIQLERHGKRLMRNYFYPVYRNMTPRLSLSIDSLNSHNSHNSLHSLNSLNSLNKEKQSGTVQIKRTGSVITKVEIHPDDQWVMDQSQYEIAFFIDQQFISEEEQGFVPLKWRWSPENLNLSPGKHILTVNVTGFGGEVGVSHLAMNIVE